MMYQSTNRACYNSYYVPFETLAYASWPPTYVTCDCGSFEETKRLHFSDGSIEKIPVVRFFEWHKHQGKFREYLVIPEPPTRKKRYNTQRFYLERYGFEELLPKIATIYDLNGFLIAQRNHPYQPFHWVCRRTFYRTDTQEYLTTYQLKRRRKNRWKNNQTS
ncbi:hypothetical protein [Enterococcus sp. 5B3_DIV0040]|uniref:hypothetical protein n=1 Tax=Enterococcus sp. 5B3_DIV0040 TaxID=1834182 RepID=UPI000A346A33|nr:hypothetical protein [Enterococcus sp. 5B3_DIV0040]OTO01220.1 hypothetical protein A5883_003537 [Enterococcus sp. 5B3_DIV0040]